MLEIDEVLPIFKKFMSESGFVITERAQRQILDLINCVELDPHETWDPQAELLDRYFEQWETLLPDLLNRIAHDHKLTEKITLIDVVYWTGRNLETYNFWRDLCPTPRPDEIPRVFMFRFPWKPGQ